MTTQRVSSAMTSGEDDRRSRTVNFSDAVVAIAATLLVLPLVELAPEVEAGSLGAFLADHSDRLLAFVLSFVVIVQFELDHLASWAPVERVTAAMHRCNLVWLLGIVFLPFPTQILAANGIHDSATNALYVGTIAVIGCANLVQQLLAARASAPRIGSDASFRRDVSVGVAVRYAVVLVLAVAVPAIGIWAMLLLAAPIRRPLDALRRRRSNRHASVDA